MNLIHRKDTDKHKTFHKYRPDADPLTTKEAKKILDLSDDFDDIQTIYVKARQEEEQIAGEEDSFLLKQYLEETAMQSSNQIRVIDDNARAKE